MAQERRGQRPSPPDEKMIKAAKSDLNLSDEQFEGWKAVHKKYGEQMKELTKSREKEKELRDSMHEELKAILTEEQMKKFAEQQKQRKRPKH
ncbi:MAG: hypothetical protein GY816_14890 [Cytophagales bacterium]|nr:hypothetical protein [Cytophagales bacterium]